MTQVLKKISFILLLYMSVTIKLISSSTSLLKRFTLWIVIWLHVLAGIGTLLLIFPFACIQSKQRHIQKWSARLLQLFGIELVVKNADVLPSSPFLLSSNHISWMDIHAINAFQPILFVAKSEVEGWPIFGWMAKQLGTVFIRRDNPRHAHSVVNEMAKALQEHSICIFPEGTSTDGLSVRPFKANLFESAITADVPVCSLAIRYLSKKTGECSVVPAFIGDMGLLESMAKILNDRSLVVELTYFPPVRVAKIPSGDRKKLAANSYEQISKFLSSP